MSLHTMSSAGSTNQIMPVREFIMMSQLWNTTIMVVSIIQANSRNWYLRYPCLRESTNATNPPMYPT